MADEILVNAVKGITELVTEKGLVNLDFADVKAIMRDGGTAMIGIGESEAENRAKESIEEAIKNPLLDIDITGAKSALLHISGGRSMSLKDAKIIMQLVSEKLDPKARVIWGARMDESMNETLRVMLIVTGLRSSEQLDKFIKVEDEPAPKQEEKGKKASPKNEATLPDKSPKNTEQPTAPKKSADDNNVSQKAGSNNSGNLVSTVTVSAPELPAPRDIDTVKDGDALMSEIDTDGHNNNFHDESPFEIKDIEGLDELPVGLETEKKTDRKSKRVFTEIFEEEAKGDLNILVESINALGNAETDRKSIKDIKNACDSLKNMAQLFTFEHIEAFAESISEFIGFLSLQKVIPIQSLQKAMEDVPDIMNELMFADEETLERVDEISAKFEEMRSALEKRASETSDEQKPKKKKMAIKNPSGAECGCPVNEGSPSEFEPSGHFSQRHDIFSENQLPFFRE